MARVSIYIPEDLKPRMDALSDHANWSEIARVAFEVEITRLEHRSMKNMETTIERIRASKKSYMSDGFSEGETDGYEWARDLAEYPALVSIKKLNVTLGDDDHQVKIRLIETLQDPRNIVDDEEILDYLVGDEHAKPLGYWVGFVKGAQKLFSEVEDQI